MDRKTAFLEDNVNTVVCITVNKNVNFWKTIPIFITSLCDSSS